MIVIPNVLHDTPPGLSRAAVEGIAVAVAIRLVVGRAAMGNPKLNERFQEAPRNRVPRMTRDHKLLYSSVNCQRKVEMSGFLPDRNVLLQG